MDTQYPYRTDSQMGDSMMDMMSNPYVPRVHFELIRIRDLVSSQEWGNGFVRVLFDDQIDHREVSTKI